MAKGNIKSTLSVIKGSQDNNVININQVGIPAAHMLSINISDTVVELDLQPASTLSNAKLVGLEIESRDNDVLFGPVSSDLTVNNTTHFSSSNCVYLKGTYIVELSCALEKLYMLRAGTSSATVDITGIFDVEDESQADYNNNC